MFLVCFKVTFTLSKDCLESLLSYQPLVELSIAFTTELEVIFIRINDTSHHSSCLPL